MKKIITLISATIIGQAVMAQVPEDVLKYSWGPVNGSARINAVGGATGALGGDISALYVNPAGIGFYKSTDIVLSPGFQFNRNKGSFRGTDTTQQNNRFQLGPTGVVFGWPTTGKWRSQAVSFAVNRSTSFANKIYYKGQNDFSSYGEQYAAEAAQVSQQTGMSIEEMINSNSVSFGTRMALYSYLIDTATIRPGGGPEFVSMAMYDKLRNNGDFLVNQEHLIETSGGVTDIALGYAGNREDKFYLGGSIGIPIVNYERISVLRESDATGNAANYFSFSEMRERSTTKGIGFNLKLGAIYKPTESVRLGATIHTPSWYTLTDTYEATMTTNTENYGVIDNGVPVTSGFLNNGMRASYQYGLSTPWRFMMSGAYVLREVEDVSKQKGFISADIEYVTHKSNRFSNADETVEDDGYYSSLNSVVKSYYKNAFNFRVGGELKFTTIMTRLGFAYYGNPYADAALKASRMFLSGGLGYRNNGIFIDLTYVHAISKDVSFPYRLPDKANTFANVRGTGSNIYLTFGFKI
jgi:hypothetical protein